MKGQIATRAAIIAAAVFLLGGIGRAEDIEPVKDSDRNDRWILAFLNGDTMRCKLHGLERGRLSLLWDVAPAAPVEVHLDKLEEAIREVGLREQRPENVETLVLRDGSMLFGKLQKLTLGEVHFAAEGVGEVRLPRSVVGSLSRTSVDGDPPIGELGRYVILTTEGDRLLGHLEQEQDGRLHITSSVLNATCAFSAVDSIAFPLPPGEPATTRAQSVRHHTVALALDNGTRLGGTAPKIQNNRLSLELRGGQRIDLPLAHIRQLTFGSPGDLTAASTSARILAWGRYADRDDEFAKAVRAVQSDTRRKWVVVKDFSDAFDAKFKKELYRSRSMLVPELQDWPDSDNAGTSKLAKQFKPMAERYLRSGHNIVFLAPVDKHAKFLRDAGLIDISVVAPVDNQTVVFEPDRAALARSIGPEFKALNATKCYAIGPTLEATVLAKTTRGAVIVGRKVGSGWVIVIGMDYYETSAHMNQLLINALQLR
ncbi:MAG: hypothetical protein V3T86_10305 [Planctomycetota bacterium]